MTEQERQVIVGRINKKLELVSLKEEKNKRIIETAL